MAMSLIILRERKPVLRVTIAFLGVSECHKQLYTFRIRDKQIVTLGFRSMLNPRVNESLRDSGAMRAGGPPHALLVEVPAEAGRTIRGKLDDMTSSTVGSTLCQGRQLTAVWHGDRGCK